jgi:hypothetical protein
VPLAPTTIEEIEIGGIYEFQDAPQAFVDFAAKHTRGKLVIRR